MCGKALPFQNRFATLRGYASQIQGRSPDPEVRASRKVIDLPHIKRQSRNEMSDKTLIYRHREEFPTLASGIHLLSHSLGPVPRAARNSMLSYYDAWEQHTSEDAWATNWWELSQRVGDQISRVLGAVPGSVQIQPNASIALSTVASCFDFRSSKRNKVVTTALDFPSMEYIWDARKNLGARIEIIPSEDGIVVPLEHV